MRSCIAICKERIRSHGNEPGDQTKKRDMRRQQNRLTVEVGRAFYTYKFP